MWARQRIAGRDLIRKAAIFNSIAMKGRASGFRGFDHRYLTYQASLVESCPPRPRSLSRSRSPRRRKLPESDTQISEDYDAFDAFEAVDTSDEDGDELDDAIYCDFNVFRSAEAESDIDVYDDEYSFDSFDTGQTLHAADDGAKAIKLVLEIERTAEISYAPGIS